MKKEQQFDESMEDVQRRLDELIQGMDDDRLARNMISATEKARNTYRKGREMDEYEVDTLGRYIQNDSVRYINEAIFRYAEKETAIPSVYLKDDCAVWATVRRSGELYKEFRLDYFKHLGREVKAYTMEAPKPLGEWSRMVKKLRDVRREKVSPLLILFFLLMAGLNRLLLRPAFGVDLSTLLPGGIIASPVCLWGYILLTVLALAGVFFGVMGANERYEEGIFKLLSSGFGLLAPVFIGGMMLLNIFAFDKLPDYCTLFFFGYFLLLAVSLLLSDLYRSVSWQIERKQKRKAFLVWWRDNAEALSRYVMIHKRWWAVCHPEEPQCTVNRDLEDILDAMGRYYEQEQTCGKK